jgi:hypothetical protein
VDGGASEEARRLILTADEWRVLCRSAGVHPPAGFGVDGEVPAAALAGAERSLIDRGLLTAAEAEARRVHPSLLANLAVWAPPEVVVQVEVTVRYAGLRAAYALRGPVGGSMLTLPDDGVELSMFPAAVLGMELVRAVPEVPDGGSRSRVTAVLDPAAEGAPADPVSGRLPLAALAEYGPASTFQAAETVAGELELTGAEAALAAEVRRRTTGVLRCLMVGGAAATQAAGAVLAGQVVWLATDAGWVGLRPHPDGSGRRLVDLVPVRRQAIGSWLSPYLSRVLEVAGDRT